jgi:photosystem II stability/assembly factor-like uncharacterized protein
MTPLLHWKMCTRGFPFDIRLYQQEDRFFLGWWDVKAKKDTTLLGSGDEPSWVRTLAEPSISGVWDSVWFWTNQRAVEAVARQIVLRSKNV